MSTDEIIEKATLMPDDLPPLDPAIAILTADHVVLSWNHRAESLTGYTLEALRGVNVIRLFEPTDAMRQVRSKVYAGEFPVHERLHLRTADGRRLPVEVQYSPLRALDCPEARLVLVIREMAPFQKGRREPTRPPLLGRLAGDLSHEIRNPMNAIFLHMDIVEEEVRQPSPDTSAQVTQSLAIIKAEVTRLHALMQDYLFLARLSNLQPAPVELRAFIEDLVWEMQPHCVVRGVTLALSRLDNLGQVAFHQSIFRRALLNMLQLLTEVMPPDTTLALSCERSSCEVQIQIRSKHVADLVARCSEVQDRDAEPILETRDDTAAEEGNWIFEPRIPLCEDLQRHERSRLFSLWLGCAFRPRPPSAPLFHDLHRDLVFANAARELIASLVLKLFAFGTHVRR